jgi:hypothetical protein
MIQDCYGNFFGNRTSVPCGGMNGYLGPRLSHRPLPTPGVGPGTVYGSDYHRKYYDHDQHQLSLVKRIENAADIILQVPRLHNRLYSSFVKLTTCSRTIWTQGQYPKRNIATISAGNIISRRNESVSHPSIGFYNSVHFDSVDSLKQSDYNPWFEDIEQFKEIAGYQKLKCVESVIGIGLPTTCGYNIPSPIIPDAYFCQMIFCTRINNGSVHHFLGWTFPHCTAVPIASLSNGHIMTENCSTTSEHVSLVLAWGKSGGGGHAKARNN